jgi:glutathione S-transferase
MPRSASLSDAGFYYYVLPERTLATRFLLQGAPWYGRPLYALIFPAVRHAMRKMMHIDAGNAARSEARLRASLERLNGALRGQRYLVGGAFLRADLTACALLAPLCLPELAAPAVADALPTAVARLRAPSKRTRPSSPGSPRRTGDIAVPEPRWGSDPSPRQGSPGSSGQGR